MILDKQVICTSCGVCAAVCKQDAIKLQLSEEGFYRPFKNSNSCNECGLCEKACPSLINSNFSYNTINGYAAYSKDDETRITSSSGGIAFEISKLMLKKGYSICGVKYDLTYNRAHHKITKQITEIMEFKGSKYIQSYTVESFKSIINNLRNKKFLVIGTPCQIAALDNYANIIHKRENLFLIDFFCHGTPSYLLWNSYIIQMKSRKKLKDITSINFRDKKYGWHNFTIKIASKESCIYSDRVRDKDLFYEFFLGNYCLNNSCYNCSFRATNSKADLRIGDLWGKKYIKDKKGISGVLALTEAGKSVIEDLREMCNINKEELDIVLEGQIKSNLVIPKQRKNILEDLISGYSLKLIYYRRIIPQKIRRKLVKILNIH